MHIKELLDISLSILPSYYSLLHNQPKLPHFFQLKSINQKVGSLLNWLAIFNISTAPAQISYRRMLSLDQRI